MRAGAELSGLLALVAVVLPAQGCLTTLSRYNRLKADRDRVAELLEERDKELDGAKDELGRLREEAAKKVGAYRDEASAAKTQAEKIRTELERERKEKKGFDDQVRALQIGAVRDGRLVLQDRLLFALGKATLSTEGQHALDKVARAFRGKKVIIQIDGHTDSSTFAKASTKKLHGDNMGLSAHRAIAVFRHLRSKGIPEDSMFIRAFGAGRSITSNATAAGRGRNRRVEILFIPESMVRRSRGS